jgi:tetratricopeptide (TPR) repeat protein
MPIKLGESLWQLGRKEEAMSVWSDAVQHNPQLAFVNNQLAGAERSLGRFQEATVHENQADQVTPDNPFYHWVLGLRLQDPLTSMCFPRSRERGPIEACRGGGFVSQRDAGCGRLGFG